MHPGSHVRPFGQREGRGGRDVALKEGTGTFFFLGWREGGEDAVESESGARLEVTRLGTSSAHPGSIKVMAEDHRNQRLRFMLLTCADYKGAARTLQTAPDRLEAALTNTKKSASSTPHVFLLRWHGVALHSGHRHTLTPSSNHRRCKKNADVRLRAALRKMYGERQWCGGRRCRCGRQSNHGVFFYLCSAVGKSV